MAYEFKLPDLGEGLTEGEIARWLVPEGQEIAEDDPLVEMQTDKTTVEIPSPAAGKVVTQILVAEGEVVPVGHRAGRDRRGTAPAADVEQPRAEEAPAKEPAAPASRRPRCARRRSCAGSRRSSASTSARSRAAGRRAASPRTTSGAARPAAPSRSEGRREPLRGVRRLIAEHMARAHREVPPVTWVEECDFTDVDLNAARPLTLKAVAECARRSSRS